MSASGVAREFEVGKQKAGGSGNEESSKYVAQDPSLETSSQALSSTAQNNNTLGFSRVKSMKVKYSGYGYSFAKKHSRVSGLSSVPNRYRQLRRKPGDKGCYIDPATKSYRRWDLYMIFLLLYTALVTPYEVAFLVTKLNWLFVFNRLVDASFVVDLFLNFFVAYEDEESAVMVNSSKAICKKYLEFWFWIDFASVLPFDVLTVVSNDPEFANLKAVRLVRLLRLLKLIRVLKASRIFGRLQSRIGLSYAEMSLCKFGVILITMAHWIACVWHMSATLLNDEWLNWATNYGMFAPEGEQSFSKYTSSIYWALMTLTTIGYGDVVPVTDFERWVAIFAMAIGGAFYAYMVGAVCGIVSSMDQAGIEFRQTMDNLNSYLDEVSAPPQMRFRLREYFTSSRALAKQKYYHQVLDQLSPGLKAELMGFVNQTWINRIYFLAAGPAKLRQRFVAALAIRLRGSTFPSTEYVVKVGDPCDHMYLIRKGLVAMMNEILSVGRSFGEDIILQGGMRLYRCRALTFLEVFVLSRKDLNEVLSRSEFEYQRQLVRRAAAKLALRVSFINFHNIVR